MPSLKSANFGRIWYALSMVDGILWEHLDYYVDVDVDGTDMRPWAVILRLVAPFLGTGDLAHCIAGLGSEL